MTRLLIGREYNRAFRLGLGAGDFRAARDRDRLILRRGQPERDRRPRGDRRFELDAQHLQEFDVVQIRNLIDTIKQDIDHPGKELDERHARIADIVVGPIFAIIGNSLFRLIHQILEATIVEFGCC